MKLKSESESEPGYETSNATSELDLNGNLDIFNISDAKQEDEQTNDNVLSILRHVDKQNNDDYDLAIKLNAEQTHYYEDSDNGAILIFLPGYEDIEKQRNLLEMNSKNFKIKCQTTSLTNRPNSEQFLLQTSINHLYRIYYDQRF